MKRILLLASILIASVSFSQNWTGAFDSNWNNASNWSSWPLGGQDITIDPINYTGVGADPTINANSVFTPAAVLVTNGALLTINANLTTSDDVECLGPNSAITQTSGTFSVNPGNGGRFIIDLGALYTLDNGTLFVDERFIAGENATVVINNGTASSGERLLMDLGGQFQQHGGTVNVAAVFAMADGSITQPSGYTLNSGVLNITGEFAMECEAGNFEPFFHQNGGTLTLNGDLFWLGVAPGSGRGYFILNDGVANLNGLVQNSVGSTMGMQVEVHNTAVLNLTGTIFENILPGDSLIQSGNSVIRSTHANFSLINQGVVHCQEGAFVVDGNCSIQGSGSFQFDSLEISNLGGVSHVTASPISVGGNLVHEGTYTHQNHQLIWNGSDQQTIFGATALNVFDLKVNNTSGLGVLLNTPVAIAGTLDLIEGIVESSASNLLKLGAAANSSPGNSNSFVSGPMEKTGNTAFVFPIGKNGQWARLGISAPAQPTDVFRAEYFSTSYPTLSPVNAPLSSVSGLEYWNLEPVNGTSPVTVELFWEDAAGSAISDCNELSIGHWNGSSWDNEVSLASGNCTGNNTGSVASNSPISSFGVLTFGFYSGVTSQALSVCSGSSVTVGSNTYTTSGTYVDILQDMNMNDSIVITSLTVQTVDPNVNLSGASLAAVNQAADSYSWLDCSNQAALGVSTSTWTPTQSGWYALEVTENSCVDTSECLYYIFVDTTICQGESVSIGNTPYSTAGNYIEQLQSSTLLDSIVSLTLSVNSVGIAVTQSGITLSSANANATSFQWFDCGLGDLISGETNATYVPTSNGNYALIVEENGCVDTSACFTISSVGIETIELPTEIRVFPNPAHDWITISGSVQEGQILFYTVSGELVRSTAFQSDQTIAIDLPQGLYFIEIVCQGMRPESRKLIVD